MKITNQWLIYTVGKLETNFKDGKELRDLAVCQFWRVHVVYSVYALSAHKHIESLFSSDAPIMIFRGRFRYRFFFL